LIGTSSLNAGPATASCNDHTTGTGNMLIARNNALTNDTVWLQTLSVVPNTTYQFSMYAQSLQFPNAIPLQMMINGVAVVENISPVATCAWQQYSVLWNSGNNSSVTLSIQNKANNSGIDDYFAIDDIKFSPWSIQKDTVRITVDTPFVTTRADTSICESVTVELNTSGAATYSWSPAAGLSNTAAESPFATPASTTEYFVTGTSAFGCTAIDSVTISVNPKPIITNTGDTTICNGAAASLYASGGAGYSWEPAALLNNPAIANPVANPAVNNLQYVVTVTGANNCISKDSFVVSVKALPVFSVSGEQSVCLNNNAQLTASGGNYYQWSPASLVSDPAISNPTTATAATTVYTVLIKDTTCNYDTVLNTSIIVLPLPAVTATKTNDISCANKSTRLDATGAQSYSWLPVSNLTNPLSASPVATPSGTTLYTVTGTNSNGCTNTATVTVLADFSDRSLFQLANAFSPNGDGLNDCFGLKYFGPVTKLQFIIYNRWGEVVFATTNAADCWDGTFKGKPCDPGNFVYYVKANSNCGNTEKKGNLVLVR
jgi:gliding motility-associated-like protein